MTLPENPDPRKPSRVGLYAPFLALIAAVAVWTVVWTWMAGEVGRRLDADAEALGQFGYRLDWTRRSVSGYPFRLDLDLQSPRLREVSGWGLSAPSLKAEAFAFAPDHWVIVAPAGVTLTRRVGGQVLIGARALRASLTHMSAYPASLSVEGLDLTLAPGPGAAPVAFTAAESLQFDTRAGPGDQGAVYLQIGEARPAAGSLLSRIAGQTPVTLTADAIWSRAHALAGHGFVGALSSWNGAGGQLAVRRLSLDAGETAAEARSGTLRLDPDGRLSGDLPLTMKNAPRLLAVVAPHTPNIPAEGPSASPPAHFRAGQTTLGSVAIGPSPRVY